MKNKVLLVIVLMITILSCKKDDSDKKVTVTPSKTVKKCKSLFIIAEDRSGSTTDHRKLNAADYEKVFNEFQQKSAGQIAVRVIGNPSPAEREFFMLSILPSKELKTIDQDALMSEKGKIRKENAAIVEDNKQIASDNNRNIRNFVADKISKHVIAYRPNNNKDITNIDDALHHLEMKVNEPTFRNYDNINILIISDGVHDASKLKTALSFNPKPRVNVFLIGWKEKNVFNSVANVEAFESVDGFIAYYKTLNCKK